MKGPGQKIIGDENERRAAPRISTEHLPDAIAARYRRLEAALDLFLDGEKPSRISQEHGVSRQGLHYLRKRFYQRLADGQIFGYRSLLLGERPENRYVRLKPAENPSSGSTERCGDAGLLGQCLRTYKSVAKKIDAAVKGREGISVRPAGVNVKKIHEDFLNQLRAEGVQPHEWPFSRNGTGYASLCAYVNELLKISTEARRNKFGDAALDGIDGLSTKRSWLRSLFPWDVACYDEQLLPWIGNIHFEYEGEMFVVPADRCSLCLFTTAGSHSILAYHISYRRRVASADFLSTFTTFLTPWKPWTLKLIPGLAYRAGAGFPSMIEGFLPNVRISLLKLDNDLTHMAEVIVSFLRQKLGIAIQFGQEGRWITRIVVEQVFGELQRHFRNVPSTTGSGPHDPAVSNPGAAAVKFDVRLDELLELFEVVAANWNATPRTELKGATPLEVIGRACARLRDVGSAIPGLRAATLKELPLPVNIVRVRIVGNLEKSVSPHVHMDGADYTNESIRQNWNLLDINRGYVIAHLYHDHRMMRLFSLDGPELGVITAIGHWSWTAHDRHTRLVIRKLKEQREIAYDRNDDPVVKYGEYLTKKMAQRARKNPTKVAREANKLLRLGGPLDAPATGAMGPTTSQGLKPGPMAPPPRSRGAVWRAARDGGTKGVK